MANNFRVRKLIPEPIKKIISAIRYIPTKGKIILGKKFGLSGNKAPFLIDDPLLVFRGNPHYPGHDRNGYRNKKVPRQANTLAVGDSQVYGIMVSRKQSWPSVLEKITRLSIYNVSIGGWGIPQFGLAMEQQLSLAPKNILVGIYTGQSIYKSLIYVNKSPSANARSYWQPGYASLPLQDFSYYDDKKNRILEKILKTNPDYSRAQALTVCASQGIQDCNHVLIGNEEFYLEDTYRFLIQDLNHPAVHAALEISKEALLRMRDLAQKSNAMFSVILIPTKEYVVYLRQEDALVENVDTHLRLGKTEQILLDELEGFCIDNDIKKYNVSNTLARHLGEGVYWQDSDDGHPTALGCRYIAESIAENIFTTASALTDRAGEKTRL